MCSAGIFKKGYRKLDPNPLCFSPGFSTIFSQTHFSAVIFLHPCDFVNSALFQIASERKLLSE